MALATQCAQLRLYLFGCSFVSWMFLVFVWFSIGINRQSTLISIMYYIILVLNRTLYINYIDCLSIAYCLPYRLPIYRDYIDSRAPKECRFARSSAARLGAVTNHQGAQDLLRRNRSTKCIFNRQSIGNQ